MLKDLGSNSSECHFYLYRCVLSFSATLAKRWNAQFRLGLAMNSTTLIHITAFKYQKNNYAKEIESTVDIRRQNTVDNEKCRTKIDTKESERRSELQM